MAARTKRPRKKAETAMSVVRRPTDTDIDADPDPDPHSVGDPASTCYELTQKLDGRERKPTPPSAPAGSAPPRAGRGRPGPPSAPRGCRAGARPGAPRGGGGRTGAAALFCPPRPPPPPPHPIQGPPTRRPPRLHPPPDR